MSPTKIYAAAEWVTVAASSPFTGGFDDGKTKRGDCVAIEVGTGDVAAHQVSLALQGARELRNQLSDIIYDLESLEDDTQLSLDLHLDGDGDAES